MPMLMALVAHLLNPIWTPPSLSHTRVSLFKVPRTLLSNEACLKPPSAVHYSLYIIWVYWEAPLVSAVRPHDELPMYARLPVLSVQ